MPLRALRKALIAFATFDSVAACRACATEDRAPGAPVIPPDRQDAETAEKRGGENGLVPMPQPMPTNNEREARLRVLADKLLFEVERSGERFTLTRTADVSELVRHERLTIDEAEELLGNWKLRGLGGG